MNPRQRREQERRRRTYLAVGALVVVSALLFLAGCVPQRGTLPPVVKSAIKPTVPSTIKPTVTGSIDQSPPLDWGCPIHAPNPDWQRMIQSAARHYAPGRERHTACELTAIARAESAWNPRATSPVGAAGLFQIMPGTADHIGIEDPYDPRQAIRGGAKYWTYQFSQWRAYDRTDEQRRTLGLAGYNWGLGNVLKVQRREGCIFGPCFYPYFPSETQDYIFRIERLYRTGDWVPHPPASWRPQ